MYPIINLICFLRIQNHQVTSLGICLVYSIYILTYLYDRHASLDTLYWLFMAIHVKLSILLRC